MRNQIFELNFISDGMDMDNTGIDYSAEIQIKLDKDERCTVCNAC